MLLLVTGLRLGAQVIDLGTSCTDTWEKYVIPLSQDRAFSKIIWNTIPGIQLRAKNNNYDSVEINWGTIPGLRRIEYREAFDIGETGLTACDGQVNIAQVEVVGNYVDIGGNQSKCYGEPYRFAAQDGFDSYKWNNTDTLNKSFIEGIATKTDSIKVEVLAKGGCRNSVTALLTVKALPDAKITVGGAPFYTDTLCGDIKLLLETSLDSKSYKWVTSTNLSDTLYDQTSMQVGALDQKSHDTATMYKVIVSSMEDCIASDSVYIYRCVPPSDKNIQNIVTPNGDNQNDEWIIPMLSYYSKATIDVYDRWGRTVFHSENGYKKNWDGKVGGKPVPMGNYFYIINLGNNTKPIVGNLVILE